MVNQITSNQWLTPNLVSTVQQLTTTLKSVQPLSLGNSENTQLITYALLATAIVGIFVYHYLKQQETR